MHPLTLLRLVTRLAGVFGWLASFPSAHAQSSEATAEVCAQAYTAGQEERLRGNRLKAIERFSVCSAAACPGVVVPDCKKWLREVQAELASVRFVARDQAGNELPSVDVHLRDQRVTSGSDGWALVPPGRHAFRFEAPDFHPATVERSLAVGERDVVIAVVLAPRSPPRASESPPRTAPKARETRTAPKAREAHLPAEEYSSAGVPVASVVAGTVGVISLGVAVGFGISARNGYQELEQRCAPDCSAERAGSVSSKAMVADLALVAGTLALGAALWIYVNRDDSRDVAIGVAPGPGGTQARLRTTF